MTDVYIDHLTYSLGSTTNTVEDAATKKLTLSPPGLLSEAGFRKHHVSASGETSYDLARKAVEKIRPYVTDVGAIVYATCVPINASIGSYLRFQESGDVKHLMDFPASHLQSDFSLEKATVIGLSQQACTGMLGSFRIAHLLLNGEPEVQSVLCVSSDRFPEGALYEQSYNLISDGATACIVSRDPTGFRLIATHAVTNGAMAAASDDETVGSFFNYSHLVIRETLAKARLAPSDIRWVVSQNMNPSAWKILSRLLGIEADRVAAPTLAEIGHVVSGDNIINLLHMNQQGMIQNGDYLLLFMAGYGLNWQCVILQKAGDSPHA